MRREVRIIDFENAARRARVLGRADDFVMCVSNNIWIPPLRDADGNVQRVEGDYVDDYKV